MPDEKLKLKRAFHYALEAEELLGKHVLRQLTLDELRSRVSPFAPGDWFELHGNETGWGGEKHRPCMLIEDRSPHPISLVQPRTTTGRGGQYHQPHPYRHTPLCQIDKAGWIAKAKLQVRTSLLTQQRYRCTEPDKFFLNSILPEHLR